jgi:hypothetical protein
MPRPLLSRILMTAFLLVFLTAPFARAERTESPRLGAARFFSLANLCDRAWGGLVSLWANNGADIDPSGGNAPVQRETGSEPAADNGADIDPNGGYRFGS